MSDGPVCSTDILDEHRVLHRTVETIEAHLAERAGFNRTWAWLGRLASDLDDLAWRAHLHFSREEAAGLFEHILEAAPEEAPACGRLRADHRALLERMHSLREEIVGSTAHHSLGSIRRSVRELLDDLTSHEARENELLTRAMEGEEIAAAD